MIQKQQGEFSLLYDPQMDVCLRMAQTNALWERLYADGYSMFGL